MKKILLAIVSLILISSANAQQLTDSLLLYYPFTGNMNDASGNGFDATGGTATLTQDRFSNANSAYHFDGTQTIDLPNISMLKPQLPISFSVWVKLTDAVTNPVIKNDTEEDDYNGAVLMVDGGRVHLQIGGGAGGINNSNRRGYGPSNIYVNDGSWHHLVGVFRGMSDMEIWIDCIQDTGLSYTGTANSIGYSNVPGKIGFHDSGPNNYMDGDIDDIRYWNRAITPAEIDTLCNEGVIGIAEQAQANPFTIYPNPTAGKFEVRSLELGVEKIEVYDLFGRLVLSSIEPQIDMRGFAKGMYYVKVGDAVRKLVKQ